VLLLENHHLAAGSAQERRRSGAAWATTDHNRVMNSVLAHGET
jgi:hypothetical protein